MAYRKSIDNFKSVLQGGGVRPTMFQVELTFPTGTVADTTAMTNEGIFLCKGSQLPASVVGIVHIVLRFHVNHIHMSTKTLEVTSSPQRQRHDEPGGSIGAP